MQYVKNFTSESVSEGHPDKVADQISDAILDAILEHDANSRVACETFVSTGLVLIGGEITTTAWINMEKLARQVVKEIGYDNPELGFDWQSCAVLVAVGEQSPDIAMGVNETSGREQGAGDQGIMFGYASDETDVLMPAPIVYAHRLMQRQAELRKSGQISWLRPDAKSQVTLDYNDKGQPISVDAVVISTQHAPDVSHSEIEGAVIEEIIKPVLPAEWLTKDTKYYVNPTGRFVIGGPQGDCGMTGRKIIVDSYGGKAHHGGGAFSGKDPSKVDRSGSYAARYVAKNIVAAGLASRCELQVSYAIGVAEPISICVDTYGTGKVADERIAEIICEVFDLRPKSIVAMLNLKTPIYRPTASYGHFGRTEDTFHWERTDKVDALKKAV